MDSNFWVKLDLLQDEEIQLKLMKNQGGGEAKALYFRDLLSFKTFMYFTDILIQNNNCISGVLLS